MSHCSIFGNVVSFWCLAIAWGLLNWLKNCSCIPVEECNHWQLTIGYRNPFPRYQNQYHSPLNTKLATHHTHFSQIPYLTTPSSPSFTPSLLTALSSLPDKAKFCRKRKFSSFNIKVYKFFMLGETDFKAPIIIRVWKYVFKKINKF